MSKPCNKFEQAYQDRIREHGCLICHRPCQIHHLRLGMGLGQRNSHYIVIGLCADHHTGSLSIHGNKRQFESLYGSEIELLAETIERMNYGIV